MDFLSAFARPFLLRFVVLDALLNLRMRNGNDTSQETREVFVFFAVRFVLHGTIITPFQRTDEYGLWAHCCGMWGSGRVRTRQIPYSKV